MPLQQARDILADWIAQGLYAVRFSGGEPTLYKGLVSLVAQAKAGGVERIAISTNGSAPWLRYLALVEAGVNDFSVSLDACCASDVNRMAGGKADVFDRVVTNIQALSAMVYTTVGIVLTGANLAQANDTIIFADSLGVSDIRVIPAAQDGAFLDIEVAPELLAKYPILRYRVENLRAGMPVRGLLEDDAKRCGLVNDDMAVCEGSHYPCIIYLREGGEPIGKVGPNMRAERAEWARNHHIQADPICSKNCLDVCVVYNNVYEDSHD
jgi:molybdenum cofactor biosynthesis enzyme MoaA